MTSLAWQFVLAHQPNVVRRHVLEPGTRKRRRDSTPGAELVSDDEVNLKAREAWDDEKSEEKDPDYTDGRKRARQQEKRKISSP
jgi:hypothetical protein